MGNLNPSRLTYFRVSEMSHPSGSETLGAESQSHQMSNNRNIVPGGFSENLFIFLSEREKNEYRCSICYSMIKDAHQCSNGHKFCYSCIYMWSSSNIAGSDFCPACRCDGLYARNKQLTDKIGGKRVKCQNENCNWRGFLRNYSDHEHRDYKFKELSRFIELPRLRDIGMPVDANKTTLSDPPSYEETLSNRKYFLNNYQNTHSLIGTGINGQGNDETVHNNEPVNGNLSETANDNLNNFLSDGQQIEYHRLVPTYASRSQRGVIFIDEVQRAFSTILVYSDQSEIPSSQQGTLVPSDGSTEDNRGNLETLNLRQSDFTFLLEFFSDSVNIERAIVASMSASGNDEGGSSATDNDNDSQH